MWCVILKKLTFFMPNMTWPGWQKCILSSSSQFVLFVTTAAAEREPHDLHHLSCSAFRVCPIPLILL